MLREIKPPYVKIPSGERDIRRTLRKCKSKTVELYWYLKIDVLGHTGLVLIIDGIPLYTIDYGKPSNSSVTKLGKSSRVTIEKYEYREKDWSETIPDGFVDVLQVVGLSLLEIFGVQSLSDIWNLPKNLLEIITNGPYPRDRIVGKLTDLNVDDVMDFVHDCLGRIHEDYDVVDHNCRNFVEEVVEYWHDRGKIADEQWEEFKEAMRDIKRKDEIKWDKMGSVIGGTLGILACCALPASALAIVGGRLVLVPAATFVGRKLDLGRKASQLASKAIDATSMMVRKAESTISSLSSRIGRFFSWW